MCGIFGYIGPRTNAGAIVIKGLKNLEYRGYDSWGVAMQTGDTVKSRKEVGKIGSVSTADFADKSTLAIAHSRWATHGGVTKGNAHPHFSCDGSIAVVHNGIIENYEALRAKLKKKGHKFLSQTDTEVIPHLIEEFRASGLNLEQAVLKTCRSFDGRYAILVLDKSEHKLVAARTGSPLIVGVGEEKDEYFIASDIPAFLEYSRTVQYLDDGEMVVSDGKSITFTDIATGKPRTKRKIRIDWEVKDAEKGEYEHFMLKEIMDQKESIIRAVHQDDKQIQTIANAIDKCLGCILSACGTAGKVCMAADYFFSVVANRHVNFAPASEFKIYHHFLKPQSLIIVVSQSGETADVLEAMSVAKKAKSKVLAIVNVKGSSIDRAADYTLHINAGPERAVASTKAATGQMAVLLLIAHAVAGRLQEGRTLLLETGGKINDMLNPRYINHIRTIAQKIHKHDNMYIIGKSWNYPMALESAIKIQEVSYIHAEGFAAGELKHGPIALIEKGTPCIALMGNDELTNDMLSNIMELKARGAVIIAVAPEKHDSFDYWIKVPDVGPAQPIVNIIPMQILAYYLAVLRGKDPDMPRNLAKSVTVK